MPHIWQDICMFNLSLHCVKSAEKKHGDTCNFFFLHFMFHCLNWSNLQGTLYLALKATTYFFGFAIFLLADKAEYRYPIWIKEQLYTTKYKFQVIFMAQAQSLEPTFFPEGTCRFLRLKLWDHYRSSTVIEKIIDNKKST